MSELARTALYDAHVALKARLVPFAGFEMPIQYDGIVAEHTRVREAVGLFDVSHMGEVRLRGKDALAAANRFATNDLNRIANGRAQYTAMCAPDGTIVDDMIVYRLADDDVLICVNASNRHTDVAHMREHLRGDVELTDESDSWSQIAVQGPHATELLDRVIGKTSKLRPFRIRERTFAGTSVLFATTGYTGERGGEIYAPNSVAMALWDALMTQGADLGVGPVGLGARDTLRLEMAYALYGNDIDRTTTPLEAGLEWVVRLDDGDFVGRDALVAQAAKGVSRKLVGLELTERGIPRPGYPIAHAGAVVGSVTSGTKSPTTGRAIALGYVPVALSDTGTELTIDCRGRTKSARVVKLPFLSRD